MNIIGICPTGVKQKIDSVSEQPLGIAYVMDYAKRLGHKVQLHYFDLPKENEIKEANVLALSLLTKDVPKGLEIADWAKSINPKIQTVVGGHHVSGDISILQQNSIDFIVVGEGEKTFSELLGCLEQNKSISGVRGLVYKEDGRLIRNNPQDLIDINGLRPLREPKFFSLKDKTFSYPASSERRFIPIIGSRGCTRGCEYCTAELVWGKVIRYRNPKDIVSEIRGLVQDSNKDIFFFDEDNLFHTPSETEKILHELQGKGYNLGSCGDIRPMNAEIFDLMKSAGFCHVFWGIESINPQVLYREKSGSNTDKIRMVLDMSEKRGISNIGMIIIGFEYETEQNILSYAEQLSQYAIHQLRLAIATPFPSTKFAGRLQQQGLQLDPDLSKYDTGHLVYEHPSITPQRMEELRIEITKSFYSSREWDQRITNLGKENPRLRKPIDEFREYVASIKKGF